MNDVERRPIRLGLVGIGKIAVDQHVPAIRASDRFDLVATASRTGTVDGVPAFPSVEAMIAETNLDAVSLCTPPSARLDIVTAAFAAGLDVMLEKPPAATLGEVADMVLLAKQRGRTLYASWHSRKAAGVATAALWCAAREIRSVEICWHEDIRQWHPGQDWILGPDGFGVFDPGINALSILTAVLPQPACVRSAMLGFPANRAAPIAATAQLTSGEAHIAASFDFLQSGEQTWTIEITAADGQRLLLKNGGNCLLIDGAACPISPSAEYRALYDDFGDLIANGASDVDDAPMRLVADIFSIADRTITAPFQF